MLNHKLCIIYYLHEEKNDIFLNYIYFINHGLIRNTIVDEFNLVHLNFLVVFNDDKFYNLNTITYDYLIIDKNYTGYKNYAWMEGMKHLKNKCDSTIENAYTHFLLLDSSVIGPIIDSNFPYHWTSEFFKYDKVKINNSYLFFKSEFCDAFLNNELSLDVLPFTENTTDCETKSSEINNNNIGNINTNSFIKNNLPSNFNWKFYLETNKLTNFYNNRERAIFHYFTYGIKQNLKFFDEKIDKTENIFDDAYNDFNMSKVIVDDNFANYKDIPIIKNDVYNNNSKEIVNIFNSIDNYIDDSINDLQKAIKIDYDKVYLDYDTIYNKILESDCDQSIEILQDKYIVFDLQNFQEPFAGLSNQIFCIVNGVLLANELGFENIYFTGFAPNYNSPDIIDCSYIFDLKYINENIQKFYPKIKIHFSNKNNNDLFNCTLNKKYNSIIKYINNPGEFLQIITSIKKEIVSKNINRLYFGCIFSGYYYNNQNANFSEVYKCIKFNPLFYDILLEFKEDYICMHNRCDNDMVSYYNSLFNSNIHVNDLIDVFHVFREFLKTKNCNVFICGVNNSDFIKKTNFRDINAVFEFIIANNAKKYIGFFISSFSSLIKLNRNRILVIDNVMISNIIKKKLFLDSIINAKYFATKYFYSTNLNDSETFVNDAWCKDIKLGIGIASYNRTNGKSKTYLYRCLKSLSNQIFKNFTVYLIGDDVDKDYEEIIYKYKNTFNIDIKYFNNKEYSERHYIKNKHLLWHVAGAYSINKSIDLMMKDNVHLYVHMDDDNCFDKTHLFNIAFCYKFLKSDFIFTKALQQNKVLPGLLQEDEQKLIYANNIYPSPCNSVHSSISFNLNTITTRYNNYKLTNDASYPADAQLLTNIKNEIITKNLVSTLLPLTTCFEDCIKESISG